MADSGAILSTLILLPRHRGFMPLSWIMLLLEAPSRMFTQLVLEAWICMKTLRWSRGAVPLRTWHLPPCPPPAASTTPQSASPAPRTHPGLSGTCQFPGPWNASRNTARLTCSPANATGTGHATAASQWSWCYLSRVYAVQDFLCLLQLDGNA